MTGKLQDLLLRETQTQSLGTLCEKKLATSAASMSLLRVCFVKGTAKGIRWNSHGYARGLRGPLAAFFRLMLGLQLLQRRQHNVTILYYASRFEGTDRDGSGRFDGCLGALQAGHADVFAQIVPFPVMAVNLSQGPAVTRYSASFVSAYTPTDDGKSPDLMEYWSEATVPLMGTLAFFSILLAILLRFWNSFKDRHSRDHRRSRRQRRPSLLQVAWITGSMLLSNFHTTYQVKRSCFPLLLLLLTVFVYRLQCNLTMRTEQVVSTPVVKLRTTDQLIHRGVRLAWTSRLTYAIFRDCRLKHIRKLHDHSMRGVDRVQDVIYNRFIVNRSMSKRLIGSLLRQKLVIIQEKPQFLENLLCIASVKHGLSIPPQRLMHAPIVNGPHPLAGIVMRRGLVKEQPSLARTLMTSVRMSAVECKVAGAALRSIRRGNLVSKSRGAAVKRCLKQLREKRWTFHLFTPDMTTLKG